MADVTDLINYYANLLILQYNGLPKASATAELIAQNVLLDGLVQDIQNAYGVDTAVGKQLDVVGKYQGINRYFFAIDLSNYFGLVPYSEYPGSLPASPPVWGCSAYSNFNDYSYNGTLLYSEIVTSSNGLSDDIFRTLIKLAIRINNSNFSRQSIDAMYWDLFGSDLRPESSGNMTIQYFVTAVTTTLIQAVIAKNLLIAPMGILVQLVNDVTGPMFALTNYAGDESPYGYGFSTYANYDSLAGQVLTYSQISEE